MGDCCVQLTAQMLLRSLTHDVDKLGACPDKHMYDFVG